MTLRKAIISIAMLVVAGCASEPAPKVQVTPPKPPPPVSPAPRPPVEDQCKSAQAMALVGRSRREIPVPVLPALQRVACTTCPITLDYNPRRLNFFFDAETGVIKEVRCG